MNKAFGFLFFCKSSNSLLKKGYLYIVPSNKDNIYFFNKLEHEIIKTLIINQNQSLCFLTNLNDNEIEKINNELKRIYNFTLNLKNKDFFGVSCEDIQTDLAINDLNEKDILKIFSIYKKIIYFLQKKFDDFQELCQGNSFIQNLSNKLFPEKRIIFNKVQDIRLNQIYNLCYQNVIDCESNEKINTKDKILITMRINRYIHTQNLLNSAFPIGEIEHFKQEQLEKIPNALSWILNRKIENTNLTKFSLMRVNISNINFKLKNILGFKNQVKDKWITQIEAEFYKKYAKLDVKEVYFWSQRAKLNNQRTNLQEFLNDDDPLLCLSLTYQYLCQIYLNTRNYCDKKLSNGIEIGGYITDIRTIWNLAYNKIIMANMAQLLYTQYDIQIKEYGLGYIKLYVNEKQLYLIKELIKNTGWSFPLANFPQQNQNYLHAILLNNNDK